MSDQDLTDRTLLFTARTTAVGATKLFRLMSEWIGNESVNYRRIDLFEQRVDGIPMEKDDDDTKKLSRATSYPAPGRH